MGGFGSVEELKDVALCITWGGTRTRPQDCSIVSWLLLPCLYTPSLPWLATVWTCPLELKEDHGGWIESLSCPGSPRGPAQFQYYFCEVQWVPYKWTFKLQTFKHVNMYLHVQSGKAWVKSHLVLCSLLLMIFWLYHLPPSLPPPPVSNSLVCWLDASPCMPAIVLYYCTFQGTVL